MLVNITPTLISSTYAFSVLRPGDSIGVKGGASSGLLEYYHLGIYLGNEEVIDYTNDSKVRRIKLSVFTENNTRQLCRIHYLKAPPANNADAIIENAALHFKNQDFGTYDLITNNCEHFVTFCTFGKRFSFQVAKTVQSSGGSSGGSCVSM